MKEGYKIFGHSAVKLCLWCKKSIKSGEKEFCYKEKFYGIKSHRCLQMTPSQPLCNLRCLHCWRDISREGKVEKFDKPEEIIEKSIKAQKELLIGLGGVPHSKEHLKEAQNPKNAAISLDGEPCMYPYLSELIEGFHKRGMTTFLVTNGTFPEVLEKITLPFQLYVSLTSDSEEMFNKIQNPIQRGWKELNQTLELLPSLKTRKVIRLTLAKDLNFSNPEKYAELILKAKPDFVEVKSWMCVGSSRYRLKYEQMLSHNEIKEFSEKLAGLLNYKVKDEKADSRVVLLKRIKN